MAIFSMWLIVLLCIPAAVLGDIEADITEAGKCADRYNIKVGETFVNIQACYTRKLSTFKMEEAVRHDNTEAKIKLICSIDEPTSCIIENTKDFRRTCLTERLKHYFDRTIESLGLIYNVACRKEGERLVDFFNNEGLKCVVQLYTDVDNKTMNCMKDHFFAVKDELESNLQNEDKLYELLCSFGYQARTCVKAGMKSCPKPQEIMDAFLGELLDAHDCVAQPQNSGCGHRFSDLLTFLLSVGFILLLSGVK